MPRPIRVPAVAVGCLTISIAAGSCGGPRGPQDNRARFCPVAEFADRIAKALGAPSDWYTNPPGGSGTYAVEYSNVGLDVIDVGELWTELPELEWNSGPDYGVTNTDSYQAGVDFYIVAQERLTFEEVENRIFNSYSQPQEEYRDDITVVFEAKKGTETPLTRARTSITRGHLGGTPRIVVYVSADGEVFRKDEPPTSPTFEFCSRLKPTTEATPSSAKAPTTTESTTEPTSTPPLPLIPEVPTPTIDDSPPPTTTVVGPTTSTEPSGESTAPPAAG